MPSEQQESRKRKTNYEPVQKSPPNPMKAIWCPYCDWNLRDGSHTARKRLGQHIADIHNKKVSFPVGTEPPDLEE